MGICSSPQPKMKICRGFEKPTFVDSYAFSGTYILTNSSPSMNLSPSRLSLGINPGSKDYASLETPVPPSANSSSVIASAVDSRKLVETNQLVEYILSKGYPFSIKSRGIYT